MKIFGYVVIIVVAAAVIAGFFMVGSPQEERTRRFDDRRISDLQTIQNQVIFYWQRKEKLPGNLDALDDDISGFRHPHDPEAAQEYAYEVTNKESFRLCAIFARPSISVEGYRGAPQPAFQEYTPRGYYNGEEWQHGEGKTCFDRTIDKELYPPTKPAPRN